MSVLESVVSPLDVVRRAALQLATRSQFVTRIVGRRDARITWLATVQVLVLFLLAVRIPVALFFVGPILFGVVHLAADVRYLALRRAPPRLLLVASAVLAVVLTCLRAAAGLHAVRSSVVDQVDVVLGMAWVALALVLALRGSLRKAVVVALPFLATAAYVVTHARLVGLFLVHAHNVVALLAWFVLFRRRPGWTVLPLVLTAVFAGLLVSGVMLPWTFQHGGAQAFGTRAERLGMWVAPGASPELAVALATTFVFMQGVHYAVWTGWIPQDSLCGEGTPSFRQTVRSLVSDFGRPAFAVIVALALVLVALALWNVRQSVAWYMNLSKFHAWFECAFLAYFLARGDYRPAPGSA